MVPDQHSHNLEIFIVIISKVKANGSLRLYTGVSVRISDIHNSSKNQKSFLTIITNQVRWHHAQQWHSSPVNLLPIQTLGPLVQVTSAIKVIMKDTFMLQNIYCPYRQKKKKSKSVTCKWHTKWIFILFFLHFCFKNHN